MSGRGAGHEGGCACGRLRFRSLEPPLGRGYGHCGVRERTTGARESCSARGTQIAFRRALDAVSVDVDVGAMDEPAAYPPVCQFGCESAIAWPVPGDALPRFPPAAAAARAG